MDSQKLDKHIYEQLSFFRHKLRTFIHFSEKAARQVGLTPQNHQLLLSIMGFPGRNYATPTELAERLQITHHACLGLISRCEQLQLVERFPNPDDGRSVYVKCTPLGLELLEKLSEIHLEELKKIGLWGFAIFNMEVDGNDKT